VQGRLMMMIAAGGLVMNLASLAALSGGRSDSLNVRGAWLHVVTDALGSVGAMGSAALIWAFGWTWADPLASVIIGALVIHSAWALLKETVAVLMEHAPGHVDVDQLRDAMAAHDRVEGVHDLHVWTLGAGHDAITVHVKVNSDPAIARQISDKIRATFSVEYVTVQIETGSEPCDAPPSRYKEGDG